MVSTSKHLDCDSRVSSVSTACSRIEHCMHGCGNFDVPQAVDDHVNAEFLKGLINVVPTRGAGDRPNRYYVGAFAVNMYCKLLRQLQRQREHTHTVVDPFSWTATTRYAQLLDLIVRERCTHPP